MLVRQAAKDQKVEELLRFYEETWLSKIFELTPHQRTEHAVAQRKIAAATTTGDKGREVVLSEPICRDIIVVISLSQEIDENQSEISDGRLGGRIVGNKRRTTAPSSKLSSVGGKNRRDSNASVPESFVNLETNEV